MVKNIIIICLSIITCLSLVFAYKQKEQAEEYRIQILEARIQAENALKLAEEQYHLAKEQAAIAAMNLMKTKEKTDSLKITK